MTAHEPAEELTDKAEVLLRHRPFLDHLSDAIRHSGVAHLQQAPPDLRNAASKACILQCVFALEALANSMIEDLAFSKRLRESVDRFQPLEKFEFGLHHLNGKILDRGEKLVQEVAELFRIRNDYVHPKIRHVSGNLTEVSSVVEYPEDMYPQLSIPVESRRWNYGYAKTALVATDNFIEYFFQDLLAFDPERTLAVLFPLLLTDAGPRYCFVIEDRQLFIKARDGMGMKFSYLSLDRPFDGEVVDSFGMENSEQTAS